MRRREVRPTSIYWLMDIRPETLFRWPNGRPFYCGKTVHSPTKRFEQHRYQAKWAPYKALSKHIALCGPHIRVDCMEIVAPGAGWVAREKYWIETIRLLWPGGFNITAGGQGMSGPIMSKAQIRATHLQAKRDDRARDRNIREYHANLTYEERTQQAREYQQEVKARWIASGRHWPPK